MTETLRLKHIAKAEEIPDVLRPFYVPTADGDTFTLSVDEHPKVTEFRMTNRALNATKTELEDRLKQYEDIDPAEYRALAAKVKELEATAVDAATLKAQHAEVSTRLAAERLRHAVGLEFLRNGGRPEALPFMVDAASKVFDVAKNGDVTSKAFSPTNPGESLTVAEWMRQQLAESGYLFAPSRGGGAHHGPAPAASAARTVDRHDPLAFGRAAADIAAGKVKVV